MKLSRFTDIFTGLPLRVPPRLSRAYPSHARPAAIRSPVSSLLAFSPVPHRKTVKLSRRIRILHRFGSFLDSPSGPPTHMSRTRHACPAHAAGPTPVPSRARLACACVCVRHACPRPCRCARSPAPCRPGVWSHASVGHWDAVARQRAAALAAVWDQNVCALRVLVCECVCVCVCVCVYVCVCVVLTVKFN